MNESGIEFHIVATRLGVKLSEVVMLSSQAPHKFGYLKRGCLLHENWAARSVPAEQEHRQDSLLPRLLHKMRETERAVCFQS